MTKPEQGPQRASAAAHRFPTMSEQVADWIGDEILSGRWGPGRRITEIEVAEQVGVSRQPVREALRLLNENGLIRIIPRVGAVVADYNPRVIAEVYHLRAHVESWLIRLGVEQLDDDAITRLRDDVEHWIKQTQSPALDLVAHYDEAWAIRRMVMAHSGNDVAVDLAGDLRKRLRGFPKVLRRDPQHLVLVTEVLSDLAAACERRDPAEAGAVIERYLLGNILRVQVAFGSVDAEDRPGPDHTETAKSPTPNRKRKTPS